MSGTGSKTEAQTTPKIRRKRNAIPNVNTKVKKTKTEFDSNETTTQDKEVRISYKCEICDALFTQKISLQRHKISVHNRKKDFECETCGVFFALEFNLNQHIKGVHVGKAINCDLCGIVLTRKSSLNRHMRRAHEVKEAGFQVRFIIIKHIIDHNLLI